MSHFPQLTRGCGMKEILQAIILVTLFAGIASAHPPMNGGRMPYNPPPQYQIRPKYQAQPQFQVRPQYQVQPQPQVRQQYQPQPQPQVRQQYQAQPQHQVQPQYRSQVVTPSPTPAVTSQMNQSTKPEHHANK